MKLFNTLTREKEEFVPIKPGEVKMYSCGPTVYNYFHIGNARPFIIFDTLRRYLEYQGYKVRFVQNFTDIDDKMINKANELGITVKELADKYIEEYFIDAKGLGIHHATVHPRATENIDAIIDIIQKLVDSGYAYNVDGDVYYSTKKFKSYGKLSHQPLEDLESGARININEDKNDPMDFALWKKQKPGEHGLLALDWWNGNRSILVDVDLTGMLLGMTLQTKPEDIYRALIEATAYGTRVLVENYRAHGLPVEEFYASGGIAFKDPMAMQIYADVLNMPIKIAGTLQGPALGSAIFGAVAAGGKAGGYDSVFDAARSMGKVKDEVYQPSAENAAVYGQLYQEYKRLHDYFGCGENDVMKRLKALKLRQSGQGR